MNAGSHPLLALVAALILSPAAQASASFETQVWLSGARYVERTHHPDFVEAGGSGHASRQVEMLLGVVDESHRTAADWFGLGNMLYTLDVTRSDEAIRRAEALAPDEPLIALERAMHEHRAGHCQQALPYYARFHASQVGAKHSVSWALATECDLVVGDWPAAVDAWRHVDWSGKHIAIEEGMRDVHSTWDLAVQRERFADAAAAGSVDAACELMEIDAFGDVEWRNHGASRASLAHDADMARAAVKDDAARLADVELCAAGATTLAPADFPLRVHVSRHGATDHPLPDSPRLAYTIARGLISANASTPAQVLDDWGPALEARRAAHPEDVVTLDLLAYLYASTKEHTKLAAIDEAGWKHLHLRRYAESWMLGRLRESAVIDADLSRALAEFPDSAVLHEVAVQRTQDPAARRLALMRAVAARFANEGHRRPGTMSDPAMNMNMAIASLANELGLPEANDKPTN
jgi:hypothetical protein